MVTEHVDVLVDGELYTVRVRALTKGQREAYYERERTTEPGILVYNPPKFVAIYRGIVDSSVRVVSNGSRTGRCVGLERGLSAAPVGRHDDVRNDNPIQPEFFIKSTPLPVGGA